MSEAIDPRWEKRPTALLWVIGIMSVAGVLLFSLLNVVAVVFAAIVLKKTRGKYGLGMVYFSVAMLLVAIVLRAAFISGY